MARQPTAQAPSQSPPLTREEQTVLELLEGGFTRDQIGAHLRLSAPIVDRHLDNLYRKLVAHWRARRAAAGQVEHG